MAVTVYCMSCGAALDENMRFCGACGAPTLRGAGLIDVSEGKEWTCPSCGVTNEPGQDSCSICGTSRSAWMYRRLQRTGDELTEVVQVVGEERVADEHSASILEQLSAKLPAHLPEQLSAHLPAKLSDLLSRYHDKLLPAGIALAAVFVILFLGLVVVPSLSGGEATQPPVAEQDRGEAQPQSEGEIRASDDEQDEGTQGSAGVQVRQTLADYSWEELSAVAQALSACESRDAALRIAREYQLVDNAGVPLQNTKELVLEGLGTVPMRVADVYHDDRSDGNGKAGLTLIASATPLIHRMKQVDNNKGGWEATELRSWLNAEVYQALDDELKPLVVAVDKRTNNTGRTTFVADVTTTSDRLWVPSVVEVCGSINWTWDSDAANSDRYNAIINAEGTQYAVFASQNIIQGQDNSALVLMGKGAATSWWLRSCSASKDAHYRIVDAAGDVTCWGSAFDELGICLGLCL